MILKDFLQNCKKTKVKKKVSKVKGFLGMLTYYHEHLPGLRAVARPLIDLANQGVKVPFKWTEVHQKAYLDLKELVIHHVALYFPDPNGIFSIWVDASDHNYHMVLFNITENGEERVVAHYTGDFKGSRFRWGMYHKELFAVIEAINKYIYYLYGAKEIHLYTDAKSLLYCAESKSDHVITYRLAMQLSGFNIHFHHVKGTDNRADFLSRKWANYLEKKNPAKPKKRQYEEISQIVDRMEIKDYYSPEEVKILLTHNFKTPLEEKYLKECKNKVTDLLKDIKEKTRLVKVGCCDKCTIEIHNIETLSNEFKYQMNTCIPFENQNNRMTVCSICHRELLPSVDKGSPFWSNDVQNIFEMNAVYGEAEFDFIMKMPTDKIFHFKKDFGYSLIPYDNDITLCNAGENIRQFLFPTHTSIQVQNISIPTQLHNSILEQTFDIFSNFPYIDIDTSNKHSKDIFNCVPSCYNDDEIRKMKLSSSSFFHPTIFSPEMNALDSSNQDIDSIITKTDKLKATIFRYGILSVKAFIKAQNEDFQISAIRKRLLSNNAKIRCKAERKYILIEGVICRYFNSPFSQYDKKGKLTNVKDRIFRLYVPALIIPFLLAHEHTYCLSPNYRGGHNPAKIMFSNMQLKYFFPKMEDIIIDYCRSCGICAYVMKDTSKKSLFGKTIPIFGVLQECYMDFAVNMPPSKEGYHHILLIMCAFSRYVVLVPTKTREGSEVLKAFLRSWLPQFGLPCKISADQEKSFHQGEFANYMKALGVELKPHIAYRPMTSGKIESSVYRTKKALSTFAIQMGNRQTWPNYLPLVNQALNNSFHTGIKTSPFHALFCFQKTNHLIDLLRMDPVKQTSDDPDNFIIDRIDRDVMDKYISFNNDKKHAENSKQLNKNASNRDFKVGDKVMRKIFYHSQGPMINRSLCGKFSGPYTVKAVKDFTVTLIDDAEDKNDVSEHTEIVEHKSYCKKFTPKQTDLELPKSTFTEIESLIKKRSHPMTTRSKVVKL